MVRSADLISYTAEEGLRYFGQVNHAAHWRQAGVLRCRIERRLTLPPVPNRPGTAMLSHPPPPRIYFPAPSFVESASPDPCPHLQGQLLASDSFPGQDRTKLCMASKVGPPELKSLEKTLKFPRDSPQPPGWLCTVRQGQRCLGLRRGLLTARGPRSSRRLGLARLPARYASPVVAHHALPAALARRCPWAWCWPSPPSTTLSTWLSGTG